MLSSVLVVCVGNICRSPMAQALLAARLGGHGVRVESAGLGALVGHPADPTALELLAELGQDLGAHRARQVAARHVREFELILVMEQWQKRELETLYPQARGRVFRLGHWRGVDIADPYRRPRAVFEQALAAIRAGVDDWVGKLCDG